MISTQRQRLHIARDALHRQRRCGALQVLIDAGHARGDLWDGEPVLAETWGTLATQKMGDLGIYDAFRWFNI